MNDSQLKYIIRIGGAILFIVILLSLTIKDIGFPNHHSIVVGAGDNNSQISPFFPVARTMVVDNVWQIIDEPVYFTTRMSTAYDTVRIKLKYKNDCCHSLVLGMQTKGSGWDYQQELLDNRDFNNLEWDNLAMDGVMVWSKELIQGKVADVIQSLSSNDKVATYNFSTDSDYILSNYTDYKLPVTTNVNIMDKYNMLVYVNDSLDIDFSFATNGNVKMYVYDQVANNIFYDETTTSSYNLLIENLTAGVYKVVVVPEVGMITSTIETVHKYINFINQLSLGSGKFSLVSNATTIRWQANDWSGIQDISFAGTDLSIDEIGKKYYSKDLGQLTYLEIPEGNLQIFSDGLFSYNDEYLLTDIPGKLVRADKTMDYDYLVAKYSKPTTVDGWAASEVEFNLAEASISHGKLRFVIGALGASQAEPLFIDNIEVVYEKKSDQNTIWTEFIKYLKYWWVWVR